MSGAEIELLRDMQAFMDFAIRNGLSFALVVSTLGHDVNGLARHGLDLETASKEGFGPKVKGYSKIDSSAVGEPEEPVEST
jgi:hypothetical protein